MLAFLLKPLTLWVSGAVIAAGLAGYVVVDSYQSTRSEPQAVVEKETPKAEKPAEMASLPEKQGEIKPEPTQKTSEKLPELPLPKFDVLTVQEDGSTLIAGSAPAGSKVEILDGDKIIATEKSGPTSQFVAILDKPLSQGPHELIIQATLDDGRMVVSAEAGIVNISEQKSQHLAMVTEPGKASRILQKPEAPKEVVPKEVVKVASEEVIKEAPKAEEVAVEMAKKAEPAQVAASEPMKETEIASLEPQPKDEPAVGIEKPKIAPPVAEGKPEQAEAPKAPSQTVEPKQVEPADAPTEIAKVEAPKQPEKPQTPVLIQAAEVEGEKLFIAGTGQSGSRVNIYIDGKFLGKTDVGAEGAFLFEGAGGLEAGRHAVRADMVLDGSTDVLARAVVSLLHEPVIAEPVKVAKLEPEPEVQKPAEKMPEAKEVSKEVGKDTASEPSKVMENKQSEAMVKKTSAPEKSATAKPVMEKNVVLASKPEAPKITAPAETSKQEAVQIASTEEKIVGSQMPKPAASMTEKTDISKPVEPSEKPMMKVASATTETASTQEPVTEIVTGSSVIIRKGDSLWRVSRRRYGEGVRYTTIFEANRDQIRDPDLIYPGQVFAIPELK